METKRTNILRLTDEELERLINSITDTELLEKLLNCPF